MTLRFQTVRMIALTGLFVILLAAAGRPAWATFGCPVIGGDDGFALLHAEPSDEATVIRKVPDEAMVSLIDYPPTPAPDGWAAVKHDENGSDRWGIGTFGWMRRDDLGECG